MRGAFQSRVVQWVTATFGRDCTYDRRERVQRFFEEAAELAQACDLIEDEAMQLVRYVYSRPIGEIYQEVGGVMNTLAALCESQSVSMDSAGDAELSRCWANRDKIRAKHKQKPRFADGKDYSQAPRVATEAEAQRGLNDIWSGDPYPPRAQDQRGTTPDQMEVEARVQPTRRFDYEDDQEKFER